MTTTRLHRIDVFYAQMSHQERPRRGLRHLLSSDLPSEALVVLAQTSDTAESPGTPTWGIHFIGTPKDYHGAYHDALSALFDHHTEHPIAPNKRALLKRLRTSQKRHRPLTALELQERGITNCQWSLTDTELMNLTPPTPIQVNRHTRMLELSIQSDEAAAALVRHTLRIKTVRRSGLPENAHAQRSLLTFGMPLTTPQRALSA